MFKPKLSAIELLIKWIVATCCELLSRLCMCAAARMWPYITEAGERQAKAMLPGMLAENKPTWMTKLELHK